MSSAADHLTGSGAAESTRISIFWATVERANLIREHQKTVVFGQRATQCGHVPDQSPFSFERVIGDDSNDCDSGSACCGAQFGLVQGIAVEQYHAIEALPGGRFQELGVGHVAA